MKRRLFRAQIRTGALGEMLQEAHLDHTIQLNLDRRTAKRTKRFDEDEERNGRRACAEATASVPAQPRRERGDRGRRGRSAAGSEWQRRGPSRRSMQTSDLPIISDLLKPGQEILVQIAKEPIAKKGARITSHIALPGPLPGLHANGEPCGREPQNRL